MAGLPGLSQQTEIAAQGNRFRQYRNQPPVLSVPMSHFIENALPDKGV
jgi:hypothetical protein